MNAPADVRSVAERLVDATASLSPGGIPAQVRLRCEDLLVDVGGLCIAARTSDYVRALVASVDDGGPCTAIGQPDRKSTRLNSSHLVISYAVFCLKKKTH